jgi:hypothetical protein
MSPKSLKSLKKECGLLGHGRPDLGEAMEHAGHAALTRLKMA